MNNKIYYIYRIDEDPKSSRGYAAKLTVKAGTKEHADWHAGIVNSADKYIGKDGQLYPRAEVREFEVHE